MDLSIKTPEELQALLGRRLQSLRLSRNFSQRDLADRAGVSLRAIHNLESGAGSTIGTFLRSLKALNATDTIETLLPQPRISPLALLHNDNEKPRRVRRPRIKPNPLP